MPISPSTLQEQNLQIMVKRGAVQQFMRKYDRWRTRVTSDKDKRYIDKDDVPVIKVKVNGRHQQLIPHFVTEEIPKKIVLSLISTWEDYEIFFVVLVKKNMAAIQENVVTATDEDAYRDLKAEVLELLNV